MMKRRSKILLLSTIVLALVAALVYIYKKQPAPWEKDPVEPPAIELVAFADSVFNINEDLSRHLERLAPKYPVFFETSQLDGSEWRERVLPLLSDPNLRELYHVVKQEQSKNVSLKSESIVAAIQRGFSYYYAHFGLDCQDCFSSESKRIYTYVDLIEPEIMFPPGGIILIPLHGYLGKGHEAYDGEYNYLLQRHDPENIPVDVFRQIAKDYHLNKLSNEDRTLLARMLYEAKMVMFIHSVLGEEAVRYALGFSQEDMEFMEMYESEIWHLMLNENLLFNQSDDVKRNLVEPAPFSKFGTPMDRKIPGKSAVWFGWQIIKAYWLNNPYLDLTDILETDAQLLFKESGYRP